MATEPHAVLGVARSAPWPEVRSAFRALARRYHADGTAPDARRMAEINAAYEDLERRRLTDGPGVPVGPGPSAARGPGGPTLPQPGSLLSRMRAARHGQTPVLDFGQYAGWRIGDVAEHDPRYLLWLSRHSSGIRFRRAIEEVLGTKGDLGRPAAVLS